MSSLTKRIISGIIMGGIFIALIYAPLIVQIIALIIIANIAIIEWLFCVRSMAFVAYNYYSFWLGGIIYIGHGFACAILILIYDPTILLITIILVITTDVSAYISGKIIGGKKILPTISPNKTWAGLGGAVSACCGLLWVLYHYNIWPYFIDDSLYIALIFIPFIAQVGDFIESYMKRLANIKDSGRLIAGHGGVLDRADGYLLAVPYVTYIWYAIA